MNRTWTTFLPAFALAAAMIGGASASQAQSQRMAVPSYFYPGPLWKQAETAYPVNGLMIINPNSGPGPKPDPIYAAQVSETQKNHVKVLGYVHTNYSKRPIEEVIAEAKTYFTWYHVDGIFIDETSNTIPELPYYKQVYRKIKALDHKAAVVLNPGCPTLEGYLDAGDIICTFESDGDQYINKFVGADWTSKYPAKRFWHIIYNVTDTAKLQQVIQLSKQRGAGWVYVTPDTLPNPYDTLPDADYWTAELTDLAQK